MGRTTRIMDLRRGLLALLVLALLTLPALPALAESPSPAFFDRTGRIPHAPFPTLADLRTRLASVTSSRSADAFWQDVLSLGQMPLVFNETAVFLYRGKAASVQWVGDFTFWRLGRPVIGSPIRGTDIWVGYASLPLDGRFDYRVRVDGKEQLDKLNPLVQVDGYVRHSVVTMPDYAPSPWAVPSKTVQRGVLSEPFVLPSKSLGYPKAFRVYTPAGVDGLRNLPVLYVTDGHEAASAEMGALPTILDNLIAQGEIRPIIAVFIDPRTVDGNENRRGPELLTNPRFQGFITSELIPWVDAQYPTSAVARDRALAGVSLGGLHATYTAMRQAEWFDIIGVLSPYFREKPAVLAEVEKNPRKNMRFFVAQGTYDLDIENTQRFVDVLEAKGYGYQYLEVSDGHSWGNWRGVYDEMLRFFFAPDD